jgi:hypothetical protein
MKRIFYISFLWLIGITTPIATAQHVNVQVSRYSTSPCIGGLEINTTYAPGQAINLSLSACAARVNIFASAPGVDIGRVTLTGGPTSLPVQIILGGASSRRPQGKIGEDSMQPLCMIRTFMAESAAI